MSQERLRAPHVQPTSVSILFLYTNIQNFHMSAASAIGVRQQLVLAHSLLYFWNYSQPYISRGCFMKRYIVTNALGRAANGESLEPGKYGRAMDMDREAMLNRIGVCCCPSPESALLSSPFPPEQCRVFLVECWGTEHPDSAYSVVRELDAVAQPSRFQRLAFAVALLSRAAQSLPAFRSWAEDWLQNRDRSPATARALRETLQQAAPASPTKAPMGLSAWARDLEELEPEHKAPRGPDDGHWTPRACALLHAVEATDVAERDAALGRALFGWGGWKVPVENITKAIMGLSSQQP